MPLGEFFSCVWLVLLALNFMTTFPSCSYCSSPSAATRSSSAALSSGSPSSPSEPAPSQPEQNSATAIISADTFCRHSISTTDLSPDCQPPSKHHTSQEEPRMRLTGDVNEGPGPPSCPPACAPANPRRSDSAARNEKNSSCYRYLVPKDCVEAGPDDWASIRLRHCCEHTVQEAMPDAATHLSDTTQCEKSVKHLLELDAFIAKVTCQFEQILLRFDCQQNYSVSSCDSCKVVYRRWVCAALIPHWRERHKIKPCRSICHAVEQKCPWFLPADKIPGYPAQYAGEPIFQCIDSNILETGEQLKRSTYGNGCCYDYCEQPRNKNEPAYHRQSENFRHPMAQVVPCVQGCNTMQNDPSHNTKTELPTSCKYPTSSAPTSASTDSEHPTTNKNNDDSPSVDFPLSSCPSSSLNADDGHQMSLSNIKTASSILVAWLLLFCLLFNTILNRPR